MSEKMTNAGEQDHGWVYREAKGTELEKLTSQGWEYVDSHVSTHDYAGYCFGHLVRRPRPKPTELKLHEEIDRLEKDITERQARARSRAAAVSSRSVGAVTLLTSAINRLDHSASDKTKHEREKRINIVKHELARVIELLKGTSPPFPEEEPLSDRPETCVRPPT